MLTLRELLQRRGDPLKLESLTGDAGLDRPIPEAEIASPGLVLAGFTSRFMPGRLHVLGEPVHRRGVPRPGRSGT